MHLRRHHRRTSACDPRRILSPPPPSFAATAVSPSCVRRNRMRCNLRSARLSLHELRRAATFCVSFVSLHAVRHSRDVSHAAFVGMPIALPSAGFQHPLQRGLTSPGLSKAAAPATGINLLRGGGGKTPIVSVSGIREAGKVARLKLLTG